MIKDMYSKLAMPLLWLGAFFVILFIYTKVAGPLPFSVSSVTTQKSTTFDVTGEGKATAKPDIVTINAGITAQAATVKAAQEQINAVISKVSDAVKKVGVDPKDIQTSNYNINPTYDYTNQTQKITGYTASTNLVIKVRNLDKANDVIDAATANGANQVSGLSFDVSDKTKVEDEARQKAVDEAKKKAAEAAKIAGFRLGRIINYQENFGGQPRPIPVAVSALKAEGATSTQVEPGSSEITVNITLSYEVQ